MDNIRQLPRLMVFAAVVKNGSFTQAAKALGITKSAVSQQIMLLENELGVRVLNRTTRGISLTALGEKLLLRCQLLQDQADQIFADVVNAGVAPTGRFAVTFPHALEATVVIPALEQLCAEYPGLEPDLLVSDSSLDLINYNLDVAIHAGELPNSSYRALPVGTITEVFCATPLYLNRAGVPQTADDLCQHRWIATGWQHRTMSIRQIKLNQKSAITLNRFAKTNTLPSALELALHHMGIVLLPDVIAKPLFSNGDLVHILKDITGPHWPVHTLHAYTNDKPVHISRFHQLVCLHLQNR